VNLFEQAARDAGKALGDCGAREQTPLVAEVARRLAELAGAPRASGRRRGRRDEIPSSKPVTHSPSE